MNLKGLIDDSSAVKDYYVFVYNQSDNAKVKTRKVGYVRAGGPKVDINLQVLLFEGMNRISVVARNEGGMTTAEDVFVYRK